MIDSPCKIEFIPDDGAAITLVGVGGWLMHLIRFSASQNMFEAGGVLSGESYFQPLGGATVLVTLGVHREHDTLGAALDDFLSAEIEQGIELLKVTGSLVITSPAKVMTFAPAAFTPVTPGLPFGPISATTKLFQIRTGLPVIEDNEEIS